MVAFEVAEDEGTIICRPDGELDAFTVTEFRAELASLVDRPRVVIDLSSVPFMDSAGLGALIGGIRKIRDNGGDAVVACDRPAVLRLLRTTRFDRMVQVSPDVVGATAYFAA